MKIKYDPKNIERELYSFWEKNGFFKPNSNVHRKNFCMVIPPPNITGNLHMGHAFQQTIMDIIVRYQRMKGKNTLWKVGTDHAGIATQILLEKQLEIKEGKKRIQYTREEFIKKIWDWKIELNHSITNQMKRLGNSVDWDSSRFTLDKGMSIAVKEAFIRLYKKKLIYQRKKISNWDIQLKTVISDLEVEHREVHGYLYQIKYLILNKNNLVDKKFFLLVETTRPETLLGDVAVAVHPEDVRYKKYIGLSVLVPIINRSIPIITDLMVDPNKGTGCVKITPAHDFKDYDVAVRHNLPMINIFTLNGTIRNKLQIFDSYGNQSIIYNSFVPRELQALSRDVSRECVIDNLIKLNLLNNKKSEVLILPYGDRSGTIIEPMLTNQWYLRTKDLSKVAIQAVKDGDIQFIPKKYEKIYFDWMKNIEDWCISRQLWWGHQIPVWKDKYKNIFVGHNEKEIRIKYNLSQETVLIQEEDVLDTWFSSGIWTFGSLGWPNDSFFIQKFHPTDIIVTGFDIIFFWISRMIMLTMCLVKDKNGQRHIPFKKVLITGLIRDETGKKMSKSKGNVLDPLDMINGISLSKLIKKRTENIIIPELSHVVANRTKLSFPNGIIESGADALRFTFASLSAPNKDINWDHSRLISYRNFCNKLWNASRFVLIYTKDININLINFKDNLSLPDKWICLELNRSIQLYRIALDTYRFDIAANILYDFVWNKFCDWYLEFAKIILNSYLEENKKRTKLTLYWVLEKILRVAHPIIPYITESIWKQMQVLNNNINCSIMIQNFPDVENFEWDDKSILQDMIWIQETVSLLRNIKVTTYVNHIKSLKLFIKNINSELQRYLNQYGQLLMKLSKIDDYVILNKNDMFPIGIIVYISGVECIVGNNNFSKNNIDIRTTRNLTVKLDSLKKQILISEKKLSNINFLQKAPKHIIKKEQNRLSELQKKEYILKKL
ncbi:Valine--tRNA ligase [Buchnera aphidicola (Eriosoma lanigerum)]|uniref:valine--tRNA ligase n=1 Tax=Buchnera aphidicola TaxID=9 RepID=UPI00346445D9